MKFFKEVKRIQSKLGELHFVRFAIFESLIFSIYIHKIYKADSDPHLHNHPWKWCMGLVLWGQYVEKFKSGFIEKVRVRKFPYISIMKPNYYHKIDWVPEQPQLVTFFITGPRLDSWGYLVDEKHVDFQTYRGARNGK